MSNEQQMFANFFRKRFETHSEAQFVARRPQPRGWFEELKLEAFQTPYLPLLRTGALWSRLSGRVYEIGHFQLSVVLALYDDGTILWLDDHSSDTDFEVFIGREHLVTWLPYEVDDFLNLLTQTKFNYLGEPQLVRSILEIPKLTEQERSLQAKSETGHAALLEEEKLLNSIAGQVQPPFLPLRRMELSS